jgi:hypothetical protein
VIRDIKTTILEEQEGLTHSLPDFRILLYGIDNAYLSFGAEVSEEIYERLLQEREYARVARKERRAAYCSEWLDAQVYPTGADGFGVLIDKAGIWTIKIQKGNEQRPGVYLEMRSKALHTHPGGPWAATEDAVRWIRETLFADAPQEIHDQIVLGQEKLSRYDFHLDFQGGWCPTLQEGEQRQFVKPSRASWAPHMTGQTCTGYTIGKRRIVARIYNKTLEATIRNNDEYFKLIEQHAGGKYDPMSEIWRVEFQLRREGVQGFCILGQQEDHEELTTEEQILAEMEGEDLPTIGTLQKAMRWTPHLWQYLTTRWLRLVEPKADVNRARWPVHPVWKQIQEGFTNVASAPLPEEGCRLVREQRHSGRRRLINRLATAITTSAFLMVESDPTLAVRDFTEQMERLARELADYQHSKRRQGRKRLKDERQEQYLRNVEHLAHVAGGLFAISGVLKQDLPSIATMPDLMLFIADELDKIAQYKGGVAQMLYDKWCREYKVMPPQRLLQRSRIAA